jgi:hypothetical protein
MKWQSSGNQFESTLFEFVHPFACLAQVTLEGFLSGELQLDTIFTS